MTESFDCVIIGSGIAGLSLAIRLADYCSVAILTKKDRAESNTNYAQGGIACVTSDEDSFELHIRDTLEAGAGLCHPDVVRTIVEEAPRRIADLVALGMKFTERDVQEGGGLDLTKEGGHSKRRILHAGDITGREIEATLLRAIAARPRIRLIENVQAIDLITTTKLGYTLNPRCIAVYALEKATNQVRTYVARAIVLATGGCGKVYKYTTNPDIATGDGVAMAYRIGAPIANMEFMQFHPTCLYHPQARNFLISEALRGEGGELVDARGRSFMQKYDPRGSLAPRDVVARAIDAEMKESGAPCVYLDMTRRPKDFLVRRFPNIYERCLSLGIDMASMPIPVVPAAHYQCGGVLTDVNGRTPIPGLWAVGETACTGLHGANRLASNSLLEALVVAHRAAEEIRVELERVKMPDYDIPAWRSHPAQEPDELVVISHNWAEIRQLMWDYVGIVRSTKRLQRAGARLRNLRQEVKDYYWSHAITADVIELRNLVLVASLIVDSALSRRESRGLHMTIDYPYTDPTWARDTIIQRAV
ncbi:MAG: L-aspartate oxidase [Methylacidiphilales bacterium]|nr:L-aspartate oxidase [Candidatus Methylacidiphilales bacterium]MDW8350121.1 L-aspartate oxidase [Verrucomicrobiae bacterium]